MFSVLNFILGLLSGILATLIAGNPSVRFHVEKFIRNRLRKPLVSALLRTFPIDCKDGILLLHCIELKNNMWLTYKIPSVYFLSYGTFASDSRAYKPFVYFRAHSFAGYQMDMTLNQMLKEYSDNVVPYAPDNPSLSMDISKIVPKRIVAIVEPVNLEEELKKGIPLNHLKKVGELHLGVGNPMPVISPGATWNMNIISEEFGFIDSIVMGIPENLAEQKPLGDSVEVSQMKERPPCLVDVSVDSNLTWPLRLEIIDSRFKTPQKYWRFAQPYSKSAKQVKISKST